MPVVSSVSAEVKALYRMAAAVHPQREEEHPTRIYITMLMINERKGKQ